jgi:hypothetical protein
MVSNAPVTTNYKYDFARATAELARLISVSEELEIQIARQKRKVAALHELVQSDDDAPPLSGLVEGLTDACRVVFMSFDKPLLPVEVRDKVQAMGIPAQSNLLASVHTTIRRMKAAGEIIEVFEPQGNGAAVARYKWAGETAAQRLYRISRERDARAVKK